MKKLMVLIAAVSLMTGCASAWYKSGATQEDFYRDNNRCIAEANSTYPPLFTQANQTCYKIGYSTQCDTYAGMDNNAISRAIYSSQCLKSHGWSNEKVSTNNYSYDNNYHEKVFDNKNISFK